VTYRVIATVRLGTFTRELQAAAAAGFRLVGFAIGPKEQIAVLEKPGSPVTSAARAIVSGVKRGDIVAVTRWSKGRVKGQVAGVTACSLLLRTASTMVEIAAAEIKTIRRYAPPKENSGARTILQVAAQCDEAACAPAALAYVGVAALIQGFQDLSRPPRIVYRGRRTTGPQGRVCGP
jgi:hypothetical protein